jgi:hypothetical protein
MRPNHIVPFHANQNQREIMKLMVAKSFFSIRWCKMCVLLVIGMLMMPTVLWSQDKKPFLPYIQSFPDGWIDWDNAIIYGVGKGYLHLNRNSKNRALRAAQVIALESILKVAAGVRLDDRQTLETFGKGRVTFRLRALIRSTEHKMVFKDQVDQPYYEVTLKAPMTGIEGLTARLLSHLRSEPLEWRDFPQRPEITDLDDEDAPWLVLDARGLNRQNQVNPALFPKIFCSSGETIYELKKVDENALIQRGMARYVVSGLSREELRSERASIASVVAKASAFLSARHAFAGNDTKKRRRRRFVLMEVQESRGLMKTNLVIGENDARRLKAEDTSSQILKKCRVIVISGSPIGGVEGRIYDHFARLLI